MIEDEEDVSPTDSNGHFPNWYSGDRVMVLPLKMEATVIEQLLSWDYPESFWGNVRVKYDDEVEGVCHNWQLEIISK